MPELPVGGEAGALTVGDVFQIYTFMAHPRSEERRHEFHARVQEQLAASVQPILAAHLPANVAAATTGANLGAWLQPFGGFPRLAGAPGMPEVLERLHESTWPGSIVGDLLIYLVQMNAAGIRASISKSVAIVVDYLKGATNASGRAGSGSARYVREQWSEFKPVAHLWAAFRAAGNRIGEGPESLTETGLSVHLALAEWFAQQGLGIVSVSKQTAVLDSSELWRVPAKVRLPVIQFQAPPLPEWASGVLRLYKSGEG